MKQTGKIFDERAFFAFEIMRMISLRGLPSAMTLIPDAAERGPLALTLVAELAAFLRSKLFINQCLGRWPQELEVFFAKTVGPRYVQLIDDRNNLRRQRALLEQNILNLERRAVSHCNARIVGRRTAQPNLSESLSGAMLEWLRDPSASDAQAEYDLLMRQLNDCLLALKLAENQLQELTDEVKSRPKFCSTFKNHLCERSLAGKDYTLPDEKKGLEFSLDIRALTLDRADGAAFLLKTKDAPWFNLLAEHLQNIVTRTYQAGCKRLVLRNADLIQIVSSIRNSQLLNATWGDVLEQLKDHLPHRAWPSVTEGMYTQESIRKAFKAIEKEDDALRTWSLENGGESHPFLFTDGSTTSAKGRMPSANFPPERALNELHWVLSERCPQEFSAQTSTLYPLEKWNEWIQEARNGKPRFFRNTSACYS